MGSDVSKLWHHEPTEADVAMTFWAFSFLFLFKALAVLCPISATSAHSYLGLFCASPVLLESAHFIISIVVPAGLHCFHLKERKLRHNEFP